MQPQDPAFLWETEALRGTRPRSRTARPQRTGRSAPARPRPAAAPGAPSGLDAPAGRTVAVPRGAGGEPPPGTLIVPLDAWEKTLSQLGNLHEAGQRLADAEARAAKAETEAHFLRERVRELRADLRAAQPPAPDSADPTGSVEPAVVVPEPAPRLRWRWLRARRANGSPSRD